MKQIEINSDAWHSLVDEIICKFKPGELISHEWLKSRFTLEVLDFDNYENSNDFIQALQLQQFAYMSLIDTLRWQMLEEKYCYLKNIRGDGYTILPPKEQVQYGYDDFLKTVKEAIKKANLIMSNVLPVPNDQQAKDNDLRAKTSLLKQMIAGLK